MKISQRIFLLMAAIAMLSVTSCKDDEGPEPLPAKEAQELLSSMGSDMELTMQEVMSTPGMLTIKNFSSLIDEEDDVYVKNKLASLIALPSSPFNVGIRSYSLVDEDFGTLRTTGTYTWDFEEATWSYSPEPEDKLIYLFPSDPQQTANNAMLTLSNYTEVVVGEDFFPKTFDVVIKVGDSNVFELTYVAAVTESALTSVDINLSMGLFEIVFNADVTSQANNLVMTVGHSMKKSDVTLSSSNLELTIEGLLTLDPYEIEDDAELIPSRVRGFIQMGQVKAQLDIGLQQVLNVWNNATTSVELVDAFNNNIILDFFTFPAGQKMGFVVWRWVDIPGTLTPCFQFNDGSQKPFFEVIGFDLSAFMK
ncbi:MAG: hypothetical protein RBT74_11980 [Tenuifilaceae bacterium]|nr:hypothetical protein [Tenuifilaceae bacterium]